MSSNNISKLPDWLKPLPPLILVGAFAALGYSAQQFTSPASPGAATAAPPVAQPVPTPDVAKNQTPPAVGLGQIPTFSAPSLTPGNPAMPGAHPGLSPANQNSKGNNKGNEQTTVTAPLTLSSTGAAGVALQKFRNSPLAKAFGQALADQKQGNFPAAIAGYREVLHQMPNALPARLNLAVAYLQAGQPAQAISPLQMVAKADPKNVNVQFQLAKVLLNQKRLSEAMIPLQRVVQLMPQNPQPRVLLAQLYFTQNNYQQAFDQWIALDKIDSAHGQAAFAAGSIAMQNLKKPPMALPWLRKAHQLAPEDPRATLMLGQALAATGNNKDAEPLLASVIAKAPKDVPLARMLADMQWHNNQHDAAIGTLQRALTVSPNDKGTKIALAQALSARAGEQEKAGKITDASITWQQIGQLFPANALPLIQRARLQHKMGHDDAAKQLYQQVLQKTPKDPNALLGVATIAAKHQDYDSAYDNFWQAIQVEPDFQPAYAGFVTAASKTEKEKDAYLLLQGWVKKHPHLDIAQKALKALQPAANKLPELTPLDQTSHVPNINTDRPVTLKLPARVHVPVKPVVPHLAKPALNTPKMTPAGATSAKSRISPVKPAPAQPDSARPAPEATPPG